MSFLLNEFHAFYHDFRLAPARILGHFSAMRSHTLACILLIALLIPFRVLSAMGMLPNFSPLPALVICSLIFLRGKQAWFVPLIAWVITDPLVSLIQGYPIVGPHHVGIILGMLGPIALALLLRHQQKPLVVLGSSLAGAVMFYFCSNMVSFLFDPLYPKTAEGFLQAQWTGPAGLGPTWVFLRNLAAANLIFTALFLLARRSLPCPAPESRTLAAYGRR